MNGDNGKARRLIVFSRYPRPGATKTRLIPGLGAYGAAELQRRMTRRIIESTREFANNNSADIEVCFTGGSVALMRNEFGDDCAYREQGDGDLGERINRAFENAFSDGVESTVIIGSDCPAVTPDILSDAFARLRSADLVLGPASDGGYYLIGLRRPVREIFPDDMPWGASTVCERTLEIADRHGISVSTLPELVDIDRPEDLKSLAGSNLMDGISPPEISVIIPALNEERNIAAAIDSARRPGVEIIVVDGGSVDGTIAEAEKAGAVIVHSPAGRARQMNAGAKIAKGEYLLFLHADTTLPDNYGKHVPESFERPGVVAGTFEFSLDIVNTPITIIEKLVNIRARRLNLPYGDQALFVRAEKFREIGGFREELPIMEDVDIIRRLRRSGKIHIAPAPVITSARKWRERGVIRTTLFYTSAIVAYHLGVSPHNVAKWRR